MFLMHARACWTRHDLFAMSRVVMWEKENERRQLSIKDKCVETYFAVT